MKFKFCPGGNDIDRIAAVGNYTVDTDTVFIIKGVALGINHIQRLTRHSRGIDTVPGAQTAVSGFAFKNDLLHTEAVETFRSKGIVSGMDEQHGIDVVKNALPDKLRLAAAITYLSGTDKFPAIFQTLKLFRRNCDKSQRT